MFNEFEISVIIEGILATFYHFWRASYLSPVICVCRPLASKDSWGLIAICIMEAGLTPGLWIQSFYEACVPLPEEVHRIDSL
jgi:hypothetical protein